MLRVQGMHSQGKRPYSPTIHRWRASHLRHMQGRGLRCWRGQALQTLRALS